jgi:hypothetical protein
MQFCNNCGKQVEAGFSCDCQANLPPRESSPNPYINTRDDSQPDAYPLEHQQQLSPLPQSTLRDEYGFEKPLPGKKMVKVAGIIMTILGAIAVLGTLNTGGANLITSAIMLACGIAGIVFSSQRDKASTIITIGVITLIVASVDTALAIGAMDLNELANMTDAELDEQTIQGAVFVGVAIGVALNVTLPILYIVGGNKMQRANKS